MERTVAEAAATATVRRPRSALQHIERFVAVLLDITVRDGALIWILFHVTATEEEDELAGVYAYLLGVVRDGVAAGEFELPDPEFTTQFLLDGFHGVVEASIHRGDLDTARINRAMRATLRALLTPSG